MTEKTLSKIWAGIALVGIFNLVFFNIGVLQSPDVLQVQYTPDDAYYYLSLARNFIHLHEWTFDSGVSLTTGFHPLWAYILAFFYIVLRPDTDGFIKICLMLSSLFTLLSVLTLFWKGQKLQKPFIFAALAIMLGTWNIHINSISGVEWSLSIFIILLFCLTLVEKNSTRLGYISLFILGVLGSMARMDFGILPLAFWVTGLVVWVRRNNRHFFIFSSYGLAGAVIGVGLVFLHNFWMTGQMLQSSALMKSHWMAGMLNPIPLLIGGFGLAALLLLPAAGGNLIRQSLMNDTQYMLGITGILAWIGYGVFYSKNSDIQPWYSVNILFSVFIFLSALWYFIQNGWLKKYRYLTHILFLLVVVFQYFHNYMTKYPLSEENSPWPHQKAFLMAGKFLYEQRLTFDKRIGAWNAGIINYYQGGEVVNLDGLVNNNIYLHAVSYTSYDYLVESKIGFVIDLDIMFREDILERSGYNDHRFIDNLSPIMTFNEESYPDSGFLTLYKVKDQK